MFLGLSSVCSCGDDGGGADGDTEAGTSAATMGDGSGTGDDPFEFSDADRGEYARVDRIGMPAVNTAVITSKDAYNAADPASDADFVPQIEASVQFLHDALDDDLTGLGLVPCAVADCLAAAGPLVVPDVLSIDPAQPAGFPNGRRFEDPVIDVTLAVLLLDLTAEGQDATTLAGVPVNPPANDLPFDTQFPYLAPAHGM